MNKKSLVLCFLLLVLYSFSSFAQDAYQPGIIREISGTVELKRPDYPYFFPASVGDWVWQEMVISTGFKSAAIIELGSAFITVRPLTRLTLTEISALSGTETININLQAGRVRVDVNPPAGTKASMSVASTMAVASVRGTSFEFDMRNLYVNSGTVSFQGSSGQKVAVNTGFSIVMADTGRVSNPMAVTSSEFKPPQPVGTEPNTTPAGIASSGDNLDRGDTGFVVRW